MWKGICLQKKKEIDAKISTQVKETNQKVEQELSQAENKAEQEKRKTEAEASRKKREAERKQEKRGFWDRVTDAVSSFFDALKSALNSLFDGLRNLVKGIIELAKKAVNGLIEFARKAVVGFIKAFGEALKTFVSIALAAFPEIAKKINGFIDQAVNAAVTVVNTLAEGLKKIATAILDAIGTVLDTILGMYQALYNMVLDALKFIATGIIKILKGIANLVKAAKQSPQHFFGQMSEELLGQDVTKPLPNEIQAVPDVSSQIAQEVEQGSMNAADASFLSKDSYADGDIEVDAIAQNEILSPEILEQLSALSEGGSIEFGESNDQEHSMDALKEELMGGESANQENAMTSTPATMPANAETAGGEMVGPFSGPGERAAHLAKEMWKGVKEWFSKNQVKIIAALVLGITGVILANILTGGAIMAALPLLMQLASVYFAADALFNISKHFGKYLTAAFPGDIATGAKSMARALAVGAIELVFALLFGAKAAFKATKAGVKAVAKGGIKGGVKAAKNGAKSAAKNYVKTNVKAAKDLRHVAKEGTQATMKNGKAVVKGARNGFSKGAKSLDDLGKRMSKKFRFRKFKIEVKNRKWKLLGKMNPWVLMANGEVKEFKQDNMRKMDGSGDTARLGDMVYVNGRKEGVVIGVNKKPSGYVSDLAPSKVTKKSKMDEFKTLKGETDEAARVALIQARESTARLRKGIPGLKPLDFQAHHIVPKQVAKEFDAFFKKINFDFDDGFKNGIMLPPDSAALKAAAALDPNVIKQFGKSAFHKGSHPDYTDLMRRHMEEISDDLAKGAISEGKALTKVLDAINNAKTAITTTSGSINDVVF